jgi:hypothetical protein
MFSFLYIASEKEAVYFGNILFEPSLPVGELMAHSVRRGQMQIQHPERQCKYFI